MIDRKLTGSTTIPSLVTAVLPRGSRDNASCFPLIGHPLLHDSGSQLSPRRNYSRTMCTYMQPFSCDKL